MNDFIQSCKLASTYPKNLISPGEYGGYQHTLQNYVDKLDSREKELFGPEDKATLDFWDLEDGNTRNCCRQDSDDWGSMRLTTTEFKFTRTKPLELQSHLHFPPLPPRSDPRCRFV